MPGDRTALGRAPRHRAARRVQWILVGWCVSQPSAGRPDPPSPSVVRSIQAAIDEAAEGATVELPPGRLVGTLRVDRPVVVRGAGRDRTTIVSPGRKPALLASGARGRVVIEGLTFTTSDDAGSHRGAGVMLSGPGEVVLRGVTLRRTIVGRCLLGALSLEGPIAVRLERVRIEGHDCYTAGAFVVTDGVEVALVESVVEGNVGQLAGAILVTGGRLRVDRSTLRGNRFARGEDGHHLVLGAGVGAEVDLVAVEFGTDAERSIAFESGADHRVRFARMAWLDADRPARVREAD